MASVLVVDDEEPIRRLMRHALEQADFVVYEAADGNAALTQYRATPTDLVIMDILMPGQDGLESIMHLRKEFPLAKVIAITGGHELIGVLNYLEVAKMLGARRTLHKPFDLKELVDAAEAELVG